MRLLVFLVGAPAWGSEASFSIPFGESVFSKSGVDPRSEASAPVTPDLGLAAEQAVPNIRGSLRNRGVSLIALPESRIATLSL